MEKVHIPKDRDGNTKTFGFITYKHQVSVPYALELFEGTNLYNRQITIKPRQSEQNQSQLPTNNLQQQQQNVNEILQYGNQVLMGYQMPNFGFNMNMNMNMMPMYTSMKPPGLNDYPSSQVDTFSQNKDRHSSMRSHPYSRERERHRDRERNRERDNERGNNYHQQNQRDSRNQRSNHHRSGRSYR